MAIKFDKDALIKHRFWLLLSVTLPLVIFALFVLITSVGADIDKQRLAVQKAYKGLKNQKDFQGPQVTEAYKKFATDYKASESEVHAKAFKAQEDFMFYPDGVQKRFNFKDGLFATEIKIISDASATPPANDEHLFHGKVVAVNEDGFTLKGVERKAEEGAERKPLPLKEGGEYRFSITNHLKVARDTPKDGEKSLQFADVGPDQLVAVTFYKCKHFYDPFTLAEQIEFARSYHSQIDPILRIVEPVDEQGNGVVQFKGWLYRPGARPPAKAPFFTYVSDEWKIDAPIYEEAWLAQEELWVQKELFRVIREANDSVAKFTLKKDDEKFTEDKSKTLTFTNPYFEMKVAWKGDDKLVFTVTNQLQRRQKLDVFVRVKFSKSDNVNLSTERILLGGEPLDSRGIPKGLGVDTRTVEVTLDKTGLERTGIYGIEQVLTWETAPVKRIDQVAIGSIDPATMAHSHRTFPDGSRPFRKEEKKEEAKEEDNKQPPGQGGFKFGGGFGKNEKGVNVGVNGVLRDRYLEVSDQSRRLPVGVALIVDQDHVDRVLTAFNNSKLRFLTTQVLLNRYPNSLRPQLVGQAKAAGGAEGDVPPQAPNFQPGAKGSGFGPPPGIRGPMGPMGPVGVPMGPMGAAGAGNPVTGGGGGTEELENNVEMVIYGVATLYERYPKRKIHVGEEVKAAEAK